MGEVMAREGTVPWLNALAERNGFAQEIVNHEGRRCARLWVGYQPIEGSACLTDASAKASLARLVAKIRSAK